MALNLTVNNSNKFEELINNHDKEISQELVGVILKNIKGKKRHFPVLSVNVLEEESIYDITISRDDFLDTLKKQLPILEKYELYEICIEVVKAIKYLEEKNK
jgi:hypothetical protein